MLLYYITDRHQFSGTEREKREKLLARIARAAQYGIDFIQLRESDLPARELEALAGEARSAIDHVTPSRNPSVPDEGGALRSVSKLLVNSRIDVALATGADGVHLRATDMAASDARALAARVPQSESTNITPSFLISVACHSHAEVRLAESHGADLVLFAPVFQKASVTLFPHGLPGLRDVCLDKSAARPAVPVLALGGVTVRNAGSCLRVGALGVAGIRLFQEGNLGATVSKLRY